MAGTMTGDLVQGWIGPVAFEDPDAPDGVRIVDQMNITLRASGDEKDHQFTIPADKGPTEEQIQQWQRSGTRVTILWSSVRSNVFAIDPNAKDEEGKPKFRQAGKKLTLGKVAMEVGSMMTFQGYEVLPAGTLDLEANATRAHGDFLAQRAEYSKRTIVRKRQKAELQVQKKKEDVSKKRQQKRAS